MTGPAPVACVKVALGVAAPGRTEALPPLTTDQAPVPSVGVLPPRPLVVPRAQIDRGPPTEAGVGGGVRVTVTSAVEEPQAFEIVQRRTSGPAPVACVKVAFGVAAVGANVPVPPLTTDQAPAPTRGVLPPSPVVVASAQIVCGPPTVAVVGAGVIVTVTLAPEEPQAFEIVQRRTRGPVPVACVNVALGVAAVGLKVPVPPLTTDQAPAPAPALHAPRPVVVASAQIDCGPPTVAVVGGGVSVTVTLAVEEPQAFEIVQRRTSGPAPVACVKVAFGVAAVGANVPVPPLTTDQAPAPTRGVLPPSPVVVASAQIVCGPPTVAVVGAGVSVTV